MQTTALANPIPLLLALLTLLLTALLLWRWRPRRITCPPSCRRCGYDVSQRPADSATCSECGADLAKPDAITTTRLTRSRALTTLLALITLAAALEFTRRAIPFPWGDTYLTHAPTSWIAWHAQQKPSPWSTRAHNQWLHRYRLATLTPAQQSRFHDHLLTWQADLSRPWDSAMGDLLHKALADGKLSEEQAARFVRGTFANVKFQTRSPIRVGDQVPLAHSNTFRGGTRPDMETKYGHFLSFQEIPKAGPEGKYGWGWGSKSTGGYWNARPQDVGSDTLTPGTHKLHVLLVLKLINNRDLSISPGIEHRATLDVQVLPKGTPIGTPIPDPRPGLLTQTVADAIEVGAYHWDKQGRIFAVINMKQAPIDRAFDVYVEHEGKRHKIAQRVAKAGQWATGHSSVEYVPIKNVPTPIRSLTFILVGSGDALANSVDQQLFWSGTITFPDVPLEPQSANRTGNIPKRPYKISPTTNPSQSQP